MAKCEVGPDGAAPVLHHQRDVPKAQREQERIEIVAVLLHGVLPVLGRLALPEAHVIRDDHTPDLAEPWDEVAIEITPRRFAM